MIPIGCAPIRPRSPERVQSQIFWACGWLDRMQERGVDVDHVTLMA